MDGPGQGKRGRGAISRDSDGPKWPAPAWVKGWYGEIGGKNEMTDTDLNGRHLSGGRGVVCSDSDGPKWPAPAK